MPSSHIMLPSCSVPGGNTSYIIKIIFLNDFQWVQLKGLLFLLFPENILGFPPIKLTQNKYTFENTEF